MAQEQRRDKGVKSFPKPWHRSLTPNLLHSGSGLTRRDRYVAIHPEETRSWFVQSEFFTTTGSLFWMSLLCGVWIKDQPGRQGARAASFPSWGLARRHVRVRKELSSGVGNSTRNSHLAQLGRARNLLKPVTSSEAFAFPRRPHAHVHQSNTMQCRLQQALKVRDTFLSISPNPARETWLRTHILNKASQMDSALKVFASSTPKALPLPGLSSGFTEASTPQVLLLLGRWSHCLDFFCYNLWGDPHQGTSYMFFKRMKEKVSTGRRHNTFLGHKHLVRKCLEGWLPAVWGPFFFFEMKIKCGYFLVVERTTLENLSSTSHVISRSREDGCLLLNRRRAQCGPRVRLETLGCTASLRSHLHQL